TLARLCSTPELHPHPRKMFAEHRQFLSHCKHEFLWQDRKNSGRENTMPASKTTAPKASPALLEMLVCPLTKQPLQYDAAAQELISPAAGLAYPIRSGIPIMLVDEARKL